MNCATQNCLVAIAFDWLNFYFIELIIHILFFDIEAVERNLA